MYSIGNSCYITTVIIIRVAEVRNDRSFEQVPATDSPTADVAMFLSVGCV